MAKSPKSTTTAVFAKPASARTGYKRKSNRRIDVLGAQLQRKARKALIKDQYNKETSTKPVVKQ